MTKRSSVVERLLGYYGLEKIVFSHCAVSFEIFWNLFLREWFCFL